MTTAAKTPAKGQTPASSKAKKGGGKKATKKGDDDDDDFDAEAEEEDGGDAGAAGSSSLWERRWDVPSGMLGFLQEWPVLHAHRLSIGH